MIYDTIYTTNKRNLNYTNFCRVFKTFLKRIINFAQDFAIYAQTDKFVAYFRVLHVSLTLYFSPSCARGLEMGLVRPETDVLKIS